jgi:hypothetical protein
MQIRPHSLRQALSLQRLSAPCAGIPARCVSSATPEGQSNAAAGRGNHHRLARLLSLPFCAASLSVHNLCSCVFLA